MEQSSRPPSVSEPADDAALCQIERARHNNFVESLTNALKRLQETNSPPKRQSEWQVFMNGYFEFQSRSARSSCTPTPGMTPSEDHDTPATSLDTPITPIGKKIWNDSPQMTGRKRTRSEESVEDIISQRRITRSNTAESDSFWQLDVIDGRPKMEYKRRKVG